MDEPLLRQEVKNGDPVNERGWQEALQQVTPLKIDLFRVEDEYFGVSNCLEESWRASLSWGGLIQTSAEAPGDPERRHPGLRSPVGRSIRMK